METSVGFGGSQFPFLLDVSSPDGADVVFLYDAASHLVSDSFNLAMPLLLQSPMLSAPLKDRALSPYLPSEKLSWLGQTMAFVGNFGPSADPPYAAWDFVPSMGFDTDSDGISELHIRLLPGEYLLFPADATTIYDRLGQEAILDASVIKLMSLTVTGVDDEYSAVTLFFDWRDKIASASTAVMPVLCGDFMEAAGYFSGAEGAAEGANWNPENL